VLLGSTLVKAARKMLMKLTPGVDFINVDEIDTWTYPEDRNGTCNFNGLIFHTLPLVFGVNDREGIEELSRCRSKVNFIFVFPSNSKKVNHKLHFFTLTEKAIYLFKKIV